MSAKVAGKLITAIMILYMVSILFDMLRRVSAQLTEVVPMNVVAKPSGKISVSNSVVTTGEFQTAVEYTPNAGKQFMLTKIVVSCWQEVEAQVFWAGEPITPIYEISGGVPFTDWFPYDYKKMVGDGVSKVELKVRFPEGGVSAKCHCEIVGEEK